MKRETVPSWLELLLAAQFFTTCANHLLVSRNECNLFCTQCEATPTALCNHCRSSDHSTHHVIQVRNVQLCSQWKGKAQHIYMSYNSKLYDWDFFSCCFLLCHLIIKKCYKTLHMCCRFRCIEIYFIHRPCILGASTHMIYESMVVIKFQIIGCFR